MPQAYADHLWRGEDSYPTLYLALGATAAAAEEALVSGLARRLTAC